MEWLLIRNKHIKNKRNITGEEAAEENRDN
jgi:hypothetical protein